MDNRGDALNALLADETKVMSARVEPLKNQTSLSPLMDGIKQLGDLRAIEVTATGKDDTSEQLMSGVASRASDLMSQQLTQMSATVDNLQKQANQPGNTVQTSPYGMGYANVAQRGLNSSEVNQLNEISNTAKKISAACDDFTKAMQTTTSPFDAVKKTADDLAKRANDILHTDYTGATSPQKQPQNPGDMHHHPHVGQP
jgi:archaellum component FlaC